MKLRFALVIMVLFCTAFSCSENTNMLKGGIDLENMDSTTDPKSDFYQFANGGWMDKTEIPSDESRWGSFNELRERNDMMTLSLVDKALNDKSIDPKTDEGKVVVFFKTAMDSTAINEAGIAPIQPILDKIQNLKSKKDVLNFMIETEPYLGTLFGIGVGSDRKNSNINALYLGGGNLGLPERDYYMATDEDSKKKREQYQAHIAKMLTFIHAEDTEEKAAKILGFETRMAAAMLPKEERRNPLNTYNPKSMEELQAVAPGVDWKFYFDGIGAKNFNEVILTMPDYIGVASDLLTNEPLSTIKDYLNWVVINDAAEFLSQEIDAANFEFYGTVLRDLEKQKPRKERVLQITNRVLGEALGKLYVKEYFPAEAKDVAVEMVDNIKRAYKNRIDELDWMSDKTKSMAQTKLAGIRVKIGYPDEWKDYGDLKVKGIDDGGSYYTNILNSRKWNYARDLKKIGKEVDKNEWFMSPQTVNAYYNPPYNEIVFPAAILQPPFFDFEADAAVNYGGMGAVIGHEISHGFDDQGSRFDAEGNMNNWWTDKDRSNFEARGNKLIAQYDAYEPLPGVHVNGEFTLGENIGDLGGVNAAYDGLQLHLKENGRPENIDGFTPEQRFFINWATVWRTKTRDEEMRNRIKTDPHSPGQYRATGPIVNVEGFYEAFEIKEGDSMYVQPEDRVVIW